MPDVINGRRTATLDDEAVVFVIGMRINRWRSVRSWLPAFRAMPKMLAELFRDPSLGLLHAQTFWMGRTIVAIQYWESWEQLNAYARARDHEHLPAWGEFNRIVRDSGTVGIFHETYRVGPGRVDVREHAAVRARRGVRKRADRGTRPIGGPPDGPEGRGRAGGRTVLTTAGAAATPR